MVQELEEETERRINEELERLRTLDEGQRKVSFRPPDPHSLARALAAMNFLLCICERACPTMVGSNQPTGPEGGSVLTAERGSDPAGFSGAEVRGGGGADVQVPALPHGLPRLRGVLCAQVQPMPLPVLRLVRTPTPYDFDRAFGLLPLCFMKFYLLCENRREDWNAGACFPGTWVTRQ